MRQCRPAAALPDILDASAVRSVLDSRSVPEPNSGCCLWTGWRDASGYGRLRHPANYKVQVQAHRLSFQLEFGPIPCGLIVCHKCDTPSCINPAHLFLGTDADNMQDRDRKGRAAKGVGSKPRRQGQRYGGNKRPRVGQPANAKLSMQQALEIRRLHIEMAMTGKLLAAMYGVNRWTVHDLLRGKSYRLRG